MEGGRARIYRDGYGVPHVRAESVLALARAQGEVTARDRSWQLEWLRRRATGTTAETFGATALGWDRFARRTMIRDTAQRALDVLSAPTRAFLAAYVEGLNAGLLRAAGDPAPELVELALEAQPWPEWMPLAVFHAQHLLFAGLGSRLWERHAGSALGADAALLAAEGPQTGGSNAWAVGGARTTSGRPLIGGDPHRVIESPGVYQQVRLACDDLDDSFDVVGFAFPGVPGVQHFAHAGDVAWAITNANADHQEVYDEQHPPLDVVERRRERIDVRGAEAVEVEVVRTPRGVVFEEGLSLRDAATELGDLGFEALLPLLRARTVADVDAALEHWVEPVNNVVVADVHGALRYRIAGRVPTRTGREWTGWLAPTPRHDVGAAGEIVTANERRGSESDAIGSSFAPPHRALRLQALLAGRDDLGAADFAAFHNDTEPGGIAGLLALVPGAFDPGLRMDADSLEAGRFAAWRSALVRRIAAEPVLAALHDLPPAHRHPSIFAAWLDPTARIAAGLESLVAAGAPFGLDLPGLARAALADVGSPDAGSGASWGETHVATPVHAFTPMGLTDPAGVPVRGVSGDTDCVRCTGSVPGVSDACSRGSVARYVWDLADRGAGGWVVPTGAHGDPRSTHHHDQLDAWVEGRLAPIVTDWGLLSEELSSRT